MSPLKKLKDPFVKVESIGLFVPIVDNFQYKKYSYLICLLYWCYAMFKFCPFVHNVPNDHHRTANICNNITCTDMIAALENSSIIYTPTCKVLIMTGFNFFCINLFYRALWNVPEIALCTLRRSLGPHIVSPSGRRLHTISHSSAHIVDYAHITLVHNKAACQLFGRYSHITYITYKRNVHNGRRSPPIITYINVRCYEMIPS